jgi:putative SOS response-associated peptidase YedK
MNEHVLTEQYRAHVGERHLMCNDHRNRIPYRRYVEEFGHVELPVFVQGNGPELTPRDDIRIRDTAPVILRTTDGVELTERIWPPRAANKKPIFNFRFEKRNFGKSTRCFIPASHFFEFTAPADPKQKRKNKWRFTLAGADWFCIAGIIGADAIDGAACFTMLTTEPGEDVAPNHDRQVVVLPRQNWSAWPDFARPGAELLRPLPRGSLKAQLGTNSPYATRG